MGTIGPLSLRLLLPINLSVRTYGVIDAKAWAKEQVRMMDEEEKEEDPSFEITLNSANNLPLEMQRCFNGSYLFLQQVYYELGLDKICAMIRTRHEFRL